MSTKEQTTIQPEARLSPAPHALIDLITTIIERIVQEQTEPEQPKRGQAA